MPFGSSGNNRANVAFKNLMGRSQIRDINDLGNEPFGIFISSPANVIWTSTGIDTISVIANNFCESGPSREMIVEIMDSIFAKKELPVELDYRLFPNPALSSITLNLPECITEKTNISIYDMMGEKIDFGNKPNSIFSKSIDIDISNFDKGVYLMRLTTEASQHAIKFIKQ